VRLDLNSKHCDPANKTLFVEYWKGDICPKTEDVIPGLYCVRNFLNDEEEVKLLQSILKEQSWSSVNGRYAVSISCDILERHSNTNSRVYRSIMGTHLNIQTKVQESKLIILHFPPSSFQFCPSSRNYHQKYAKSWKSMTS
jgi:hypothetical protein